MTVTILSRGEERTWHYEDDVAFEDLKLKLVAKQESLSFLKGYLQALENQPYPFCKILRLEEVIPEREELIFVEEWETPIDDFILWQECSF